MLSQCCSSAASNGCCRYSSAAGSVGLSCHFSATALQPATMPVSPPLSLSSLFWVSPNEPRRVHRQGKHTGVVCSSMLGSSEKTSLSHQITGFLYNQTASQRARAYKQPVKHLVWSSFICIGYYLWDILLVSYHSLIYIVLSLNWTLPMRNVRNVLSL